MSVRKHRREGGAKKPLSPEHKSSHPGPFSFDDTHELDDAGANATPDHTDEEKGKPGKKSSRQKLLERKQKKARKEDAI